MPGRNSGSRNHIHIYIYIHTYIYIYTIIYICVCVWVWVWRSKINLRCGRPPHAKRGEYTKNKGNQHAEPHQGSGSAQKSCKVPGLPWAPLGHPWSSNSDQQVLSGKTSEPTGQSQPRQATKRRQAQTQRLHKPVNWEPSTFATWMFFTASLSSSQWIERDMTHARPNKRYADYKGGPLQWGKP